MMTVFTKLMAAATLVISFGTGPAAHVMPAGSILRHLTPKSFSATPPPLGYAIFCLNNPGDCRQGGERQVRYTSGLLSKLNAVNQSVNRQIRYKKDGRDVWKASVRSGDCEDYVLTKRKQLIRLGLSPSALRVAAVRTSRGEGHAVLVVKTDRGELVLDSIKKTITRRQNTSYTWIAMASENPRRWIRN
ncbi:hypothetical protein ASG43_20995 [Aureimonas sp. Leaf454]|nr:hypothetical protein ASG43_20995 [Aureimonas sp. Leaf454]